MLVCLPPLNSQLLGYVGRIILANSKAILPRQANASDVGEKSLDIFLVLCYIHMHMSERFLLDAFLALAGGMLLPVTAADEEMDFRWVGEEQHSWSISGRDDVFIVFIGKQGREIILSWDTPGLLWLFAGPDAVQAYKQIVCGYLPVGVDEIP